MFPPYTSITVNVLPKLANVLSCFHIFLPSHFFATLKQERSSPTDPAHLTLLPLRPVPPLFLLPSWSLGPTASLTPSRHYRRHFLTRMIHQKKLPFIPASRCVQANLNHRCWSCMPRCFWLTAVSEQDSSYNPHRFRSSSSPLAA